MNTTLINKIQKPHIRADHPNFKVGDTVSVNTIIREGEKQRIQVFKGLVISINGSGTDKMFTVRKISYGIGVEKVFPINSKNIESITVEKHGKVRRSNLYYLRDRVGKLALKVKPGKPAPVVEHEDESQEVLEERGEVELAKLDDTVETSQQSEQETQEEETQDSKQSAEVEDDDSRQESNSEDSEQDSKEKTE